MRDANIIAALVTVMIIFCEIVDINWALEQPMSSLFGYCTFVEQFFAHTTSRRMVTYLGSYGAPTVKVLPPRFASAHRLFFQTGKDKKLVTAALPKPANQFPTYHVYRLALVFGNLQFDVDSTSGSGYKIVVELPFGALVQEVPSRLEFGPARIKDPLGRFNIRPWPRHLVEAVCAVCIFLAALVQT